MHKDLREPHGVILPDSVLDVLTDMTRGALRVFIYLCGRDQGKPFAASIPTIEEAAGTKTRSVISALHFLVERQLLTCVPGSGNKPNHYAIPRPTAPTKQINRPASETSDFPTTEKLIALCYRGIHIQEVVQIQRMFPDEVVLRAKLVRLKQAGGVAADTDLSFFLAVLSGFD